MKEQDKDRVKDELHETAESSGGPPEDDVIALKEQLRQQSEQIDALISQLKREISSSLNRQLFFEREMRSMQERANEGLLRKLIEVMDNFERALSSVPQSDGPLRQGVELIYKQLEDLLRKEGVEEIVTVGSLFDCNLHEAVDSEDTNSCPEGTITAELEKGYVYKGKVLRAAKVRVARKEKSAQDVKKETEESDK